MDGSLLVPALIAVAVVGMLMPSLFRVCGGLLVIDALLTLWSHGWDSAAVPGFTWRLAGGLGLWLFGHLVHRLKYGQWRTRLGRAAWRRTPLRLISPRDPAF